MIQDSGEHEDRHVDAERLGFDRDSAQVDRLPRRSKDPLLNAAHFVHRALRGRYPLAVVLGVVVAAIAAFAGHRLGKPVYHSEGLVRIAYTLPEVSQQTDQNRPLPVFDTFMQSQKLLITSQRVVDQAIQDPIWKAKGFQVPPDPEHWFARHLLVEVKPRSEYIQIGVTDSDPQTAAIAVNSIINAYSDLYNSQDKQLERARIGVLDDRRTYLEGRIQELKSELGLAVKEYGSTKLDMLYMTAEQRLTKLDAAMSDLRLAMATAPSRPEDAVRQVGPAATQPASSSQVQASPQLVASAAKPPPELTLDQIAMLDGNLKAMLDEKAKIQAELDSLSQEYGSRYKAVIAAKASLEQAQARIDHEADVFRRFHAATAQNIGDPRNSPISTAGKSRETLAANLASLGDLYKEAKADMIRIGNKRYELQQQEAEVDSLTTELNQKQHRIETLKDEGALGGRLSVVGTGVAPLAPDKDPRLLIGGAAGMAGFCTPAAVLVLLSLLRRRYHYSDDTETDFARLPLLGILPDLEGHTDPQQMLSVSHSIHQIRVLLASQSSRAGSQSYLLTSANAGEGKTSLTMALGLSFATARLRTLVIDCDLVGQHLSKALQAEDMVGLSDALASGSMSKMVRRTSSGLFILPAGKARAADACSVSSLAIRMLLDQARRHFDVILVDSGPILGSVEAAVVAQEVDGVIFTISRGQHRNTVRNALVRLGSLGVRIEGFIFNRAKAYDFDRSPYGSSSRSASDHAPALPTMEYDPEATSRFGPLVSAVAGGLPVGDNN